MVITKKDKEVTLLGYSEMVIRAFKAADDGGNNSFLNWLVLKVAKSVEHLLTEKATTELLLRRARVHFNAELAPVKKDSPLEQLLADIDAAIKE